MWIGIAKVLLVILMVLAALSSIILAINSAWWWILVGPLIMLISGVTFGLFIEMCSNIAESTETLSSILYQLRRNDQTVSSGHNTALSRLTGSLSGENVPQFWECPDCGEHNDKNTSICKGCGKYK